MRVTAMIVLLISLMGCKESSTNGMTLTTTHTDTLGKTAQAGQLSYLALGDSYTIGESVAQNLSFPYQLSEVLSKQGLAVEAPKIIATTGWTTDELQSAISSSALNSKFDIVTLLIGVNNQFRGNSIDIYRNEFKDLLQRAVDFAGGKAQHVFVISIPDWGATPFGRQSGRGVENIGKAIDAFNAVNKEETLKAGISYTDITAESRNAATDNGLVASDGLHPSGKMYREWVELLAPAVVKQVK